jgi:hypothetical protein
MVSAFHAKLFSLPLPLLNHVLQAADTLNERSAAFGATLVPLHSQLILSLSGISIK